MSTPGTGYNPGMGTSPPEAPKIRKMADITNTNAFC
jgi:hypothetical protein